MENGEMAKESQVFGILQKLVERLEELTKKIKFVLLYLAILVTSSVRTVDF